MRILGLDMGSKTIGVAMSDPLGWTAQGITTIRRTKKARKRRRRWRVPPWRKVPFPSSAELQIS